MEINDPSVLQKQLFATTMNFQIVLITYKQPLIFTYNVQLIKFFEPFKPLPKYEQWIEPHFFQDKNEALDFAELLLQDLIKQNEKLMYQINYQRKAE